MLLWRATTIALLLLLPTAASAAVFISDEDALSLKEPVNDDLFATGETVIIDQTITGDLFAAGERVTISETVTEDVFAAGGIIEVQGNVQDDTFIAGNTLTMTGETGDLFAAGSTITLSPTANIAGDAYLTGQTIELAGTYAGDVRVAGQTIVVKSGTTIAGDLVTAGRTPIVEDNVSIEGERRHEAMTEQGGVNTWGILVGIVMWFITGLALTYGLPRFTTQLLTTPPQPLKTFFVGLAWIILCVPILVLLAMSVIGIPLMVIGLLATALLLVSALGYTAVFIGSWVQGRVVKTGKPLTWYYILIGAALYSLLGYVPVLGVLFCVLVTVWVVGMLLRLIWSYRQKVAPT